MKQRLFCLLAVLALLPAASYGQFTSVVASVTTAGMGGVGSPISCSWNSSWIFSYLGDYSQGDFYLINSAGNPIYQCSLPAGVTVSDISICNDVAFFCGTGDDGTGQIVSALGCIDLNSFLNVGTTISVDIFPVPECDGFLQIEAYLNPCTGQETATALGYNMAAGPYAEFFVVEFADILSYTGAYDYNTLQDYGHQYSLTATDSYVVLAGSHGANPDAVAIYRMDKCNLIGDLGTGEVYLYPNGLGEQEVVSWPVTTAMVGEEMAMAYMHEDAATGDIYTRVCTFDMSSMSMTAIQDILEPEKTSPTAIAYLPVDDHLAVLTWGDPPNQEYRCSYVDRWATAYYTTDYVFISGYGLWGLSVHDGQYLIMGNGDPFWWMIDETAPLPLNTPIISTPGPCPDNGYIDVDIPSIFNWTILYDPWNQFGNWRLYQSGIVTITSCSIASYCVSL